MDKTESIATVDDAVKKLVLLDSKDKIWTQEMLLQVTDKAVRLLDCDTQVQLHICPHIMHIIMLTFTLTCVALFYLTELLNSSVVLLQEELENFPLPTIHMSQTVLNQTRYPSVLLLVCQDKEQHKPDIHFFHCDEVEVSLSLNVTGSAQLHPLSSVHDQLALCFGSFINPSCCCWSARSDFSAVGGSVFVCILLPFFAALFRDVCSREDIALKGCSGFRRKAQMFL